MSKYILGWKASCNFTNRFIQNWVKGALHKAENQKAETKTQKIKTQKKDKAEKSKRKY